MPKGHILDERMARVQRNMLNIQSVLLSRNISGLFPNTVNLFNKEPAKKVLAGGTGTLLPMPLASKCHGDELEIWLTG